MKGPVFCAVTLVLLATSSSAIQLTGSNGRTIDFAGIKEANKTGLVLKVKANSREVTVPWEKFDLAKLEAENPEMHAAYKAATESGEATTLNLGTYKRSGSLGGGPTGQWIKPDIAEASDKIGVGDGDAKRDLSPYVFETKGASLPFRAFVPKRIKDTDKLPLVVYLHGVGQRGKDNAKQISGHSLVFIKEKNQKKYPCIFLSPQCPDGEYWTTKGDESPGSMVAALVEEIAEKIPQVDENRLYITGYSMGGFGTCTIIKAFPKMFAAGVPMAGGSGGFTRKNIIPIWLFYNTDDKVVKMIPIAEKIIESSKDAGMPVKVTVYNEGGHGTPNKGYKENELLPWIFSQKKEGKGGGKRRSGLPL